jgi:RNA polymerase sigma-70 factor, ECF subfamily
MDFDPIYEQIYRQESGRILATLIRLLGSFDLAEEAMQEAFAVALEQWPAHGLPANPGAWLVSTAYHKAVDLLRRQARLESKREELKKIAQLEQQLAEVDQEMRRHNFPRNRRPDHARGGDDSRHDLDSDGHVSGDDLNANRQNNDGLNDDRLRLIFTCCHPALAIEAQAALTLRTLCGLTTEQIARGFLVAAATMAQRLVRAKQKIRDAHIPYRVPPPKELAERLDAVLLVVYLVFNEGYSASSGDSVIRHELSAEAIRIGRLICELLPRRPEARALLALMLLQNSRREARMTKEKEKDKDGEIILLENQDRALWNQEEIREGLELVESALRAGAAGPYALQAAIAAVHARASRAEETDWPQIAGLYKVLLRVQPSPVVELNHAAAVAMAKGPAAGLALLDELESRAELRDYHFVPAARADLFRRLEQWPQAAAAYRRALSLVTNEAERRFLTRRLAEAESRS